MKNAEKFKSIFGLYATELWAMDENNMLKWLNAECKEPERKTGEWIPLGVRHGWICSKCRKENVYAFSMDDNLEYVLQDYFCPNCGADMRGEQHESD